MKIEEYEAIQELADVFAIKYKYTDCFKAAEESVGHYVRLSKKDIITAAQKLLAGHSYDILAGEYDEMESIAKYRNKVRNDMINEQVAIESAVWSRE